MMNTNDEEELLKVMVVDHELRSKTIEIVFLYFKIEISKFTFCKVVKTFSSSVVDDVGYNT